MKLALWSPLPPAGSGIADFAAEQLPALAARVDLSVVVYDPAAVDPGLAARFRILGPEPRPAADLDLYHVGNSPAHAYAYRAALAQPGVVALHDVSLHHLVLSETVERDDTAAYRRQMRAAYGATGAFVAGQVARALGGAILPALYPLNEHLLDAALAVVTLSRSAAERVRPALNGRPLLALPHHLALPLDPVPSQDQARRELGLPADALIVTAPGLATASKRLDVVIPVVARLRLRFPSLRLVVAGAVEPQLPLAEWSRAAGLGEALVVSGRVSLPDFERHLAAADVVLALRFPSFGEMSGAAVRALGVGRATLVTAGSPAALEFPEGVLVPIDPGPTESEELHATLERLLDDAPLRESLGRLARSHVLEAHRLEDGVGTLVAFLEEVRARKAELLEVTLAARRAEGGLTGRYLEEVRHAARSLGLASVPADIVGLLRELGAP